MPLLKAENLCVCYGSIKGIHRVSLSVEAGEAVALLGVNGAGKSTTLLGISGAKRPSAGTVSWCGKDITFLPAESRVKLGISLVPEGRHVFCTLTVRENLLVGAHTCTLSESKVEEIILEIYDIFPALYLKRGCKAGTLSGGQQQMLAIGRALMCRPRLLMIDEMTMGLSPALCGEVYAQAEKLRRSGISLILSGQDTGRLTSLCDSSVTIVNGYSAKQISTKITPM